jgi:hypothetical protein
LQPFGHRRGIKTHHPAQAFVVPDEQLPPAIAIPFRRALQEPVHVAGVFRAHSPHDSLIARRDHPATDAFQLDAAL